jgi:hemolysin III
VTLPHLPLVDDAVDHPEPKPTWRGWIHAGMTPVAIAAGIVLICLANGTEAKWACALYAFTSLLLFGNSALYHRINWSPPVKRTLKRIDHSNIFLLIAGSYTPLSLLGLQPGPGLVLFLVVWGLAIVGVGFRIFWLGAPRWLYVVAYIGLGLSAVVDFPLLFATSVPMMVLVCAGGAFYIAGAVAYALKRPNPFPGRFGFHEVFHTCTVLAFLAQWTGILIIALHPVH